MMTNVFYEGGFWGWFAVSYTSLAWHMLVSVLFGYYLLRKMLVRGGWKLFWVASGFGMFWGLWSLVYWLPENLEDATLLEEGFRLGIWPVSDFALYVGAMVMLLIVGYVGMRGKNSQDFEPSKWLIGVMCAAGVFFFVAMVVLVNPWWVLKFVAVMLPTFGALWRLKQIKKDDQASILMNEPVKLTNLWALLWMGMLCVGIYAGAMELDLAEDLIRIVSAWGLIFGATGVGYVLWIGAMGSVWFGKIKKRNQIKKERLPF